MKKLLYIFTTLTFFVSVGNAQEADVSQYFDDGGISLRNRIVKVGIDFFNGEYSLSLEHELVTNLSVEASLGLISLSRQNKRYEENPIEDFPHWGTGCFFAAKLRYYVNDYYERWYFAMEPRLNIIEGKLYADFIFLNGGYQVPLFKIMTLDLNAGAGIRIYQYMEKAGVITPGKVWDTRLFIPATIKLGYTF